MYYCASVFEYALLWLSIIMCSFYQFIYGVLFHHDSCAYYRNLSPFYPFWTTHLGFPTLGSSGSATTDLPARFFQRTFSLNIGLSMLPPRSFMPCLHSLLGYSIGEFQALQLIVLVVLGAVDQPLASCMLVHLLEILFEMIVGVLVCHSGEHPFIMMLHISYRLAIW